MDFNNASSKNRKLIRCIYEDFRRAVSDVFGQCVLNNTAPPHYPRSTEGG